MLDILLRAARWSGRRALGLFRLMPIASARAAATAVNSCQTLSAPGNYGIAAKGSGSSNLDVDTSNGACTAINNKAP